MGTLSFKSIFATYTVPLPTLTRPREKHDSELGNRLVYPKPRSRTLHMIELKNSLLLLTKRDFKPSSSFCTSAAKLQQQKNIYCATSLILVSECRKIGTLSFKFIFVTMSCTTPPLPPHCRDPQKSVTMILGIVISIRNPGVELFSSVNLKVPSCCWKREIIANQVFHFVRLRQNGNKKTQILYYYVKFGKRLP